MKKIIFALLLTTPLLSIANPHPRPRLFLQNCTNNTHGVDPFFQSCVNNNNYTVARVVGGPAWSCTNYSQEVDPFFTNCVNQNFRDMQMRLRNRVYLQECQNYNRQTLDFYFVSCVNNNYREIERAINFPR